MLLFLFAIGQFLNDLANLLNGGGQCGESLLALQNPQKYEQQIWLDIWHWTQLSRAINFLLKIMFLFCESIFNPGQSDQMLN